MKAKKTVAKAAKKLANPLGTKPIKSAVSAMKGKKGMC